jgi:hypothetical protein
MSIVIHSNSDRREYFFSTDHCQGVHASNTYPKGFVPTTFHLPHYVVPRPTCPSGWVRTVADVILIYHPGDREIPNPDPSYQPTER